MFGQVAVQRPARVMAVFESLRLGESELFFPIIITL
jgi:hypothetical protein